MQTIKIVVTGAYAAGKTHFIRSISEIDPVSTEYAVSDPVERLQKQETTVALDFGIITINDDLALYLFGTPGQERFDFMWEHLSIGCLGYVLMVDSCRPAHFEESQRLLSRFQTITDAPFVVAANKQDDPTALPISYIRKRFQLASHIPVVPCVATDRASVKAVLVALIEHIEQMAMG